MVPHLGVVGMRNVPGVFGGKEGDYVKALVLGLPEFLLMNQHSEMG